MTGKRTGGKRIQKKLLKETSIGMLGMPISEMLTVKSITKSIRMKPLSNKLEINELYHITTATSPDRYHVQNLVRQLETVEYQNQLPVKFVIRMGSYKDTIEIIPNRFKSYGYVIDATKVFTAINDVIKMVKEK